MVNQIARKTGKLLINSGEKMGRSGFNLIISETSGLKARKIISTLFPDAKIILMDGKYNVIPWKQWKEIIDWETTDLIKYRKAHFDCDDFAYLFKYNVIKIFDTPCVIAHGHCYDLNGKWLFGHLWNAIITSYNSFYFYEPIHDEWVKYEGKKIIIHNREYRPLKFEF